MTPQMDVTRHSYRAAAQAVFTRMSRQGLLPSKTFRHLLFMVVSWFPGCWTVVAVGSKHFIPHFREQEAQSILSV